jgi:hypothetical protein
MAWPTAALLTAIVVLEGARRLGPGDVVMRRALFGQWTVGRHDDRRWTLVSWIPPLWTSVVLPGASPARARDAAGPLAAAGPWYHALRVLGGATLVALVAGIPYAEARFTARGVLLAIALVMVLAAATALLGVWARRRLSLPLRPALAALSPFAAPHAAERLLEHALAAVSPVAVAQTLLPAERFREWIRPRVYDASAAGTSPDTEIQDVVSAAARAAILAAPPAADAPLFCPRCGAVYREGVMCADCATVPLRPIAGADTPGRAR